MRQIMGRFVGFAALLLACGGLAFGQSGAGSSGGGGKPAKDPKKPATLEEMLAKALKDNPDIRVAESKVRETEAELNRVKLQVMQKVVALQQSLEAQKAAVALAEADVSAASAKLDRARRLFQTKAAPAESIAVAEGEMQIARAKVLQAKAALAQVESELPYLLGTPPGGYGGGMRGGGGLGGAGGGLGGMMGMGGMGGIGGGMMGIGGGGSGGGMMGIGGGGSGGGMMGIGGGMMGIGGGAMGGASARPTVQGSMAEKIRKALDTRVKVDYKNQSFHAILKDLQKKMPGVSFRILLDEANGEGQPGATNLHLEEEVPLGAAFQLLEDTFQRRYHLSNRDVTQERIQFVVREYGILVAGEHQLPPGAVLLQEFWKSDAGKEKPKTEGAPSGASTGRNPPANDIEGTVKALEAQSGLVTISVGSNAGLAKGHTLEVYRLTPQPKYLCSIRILDVKANEAVGKPIKLGRWDHLQAGDRVSTKIFPE